MARGEHFNHKKKGHPGKFPKSAAPRGKRSEEAPGDEEFIVVREAFKNRVEEE